MTDPGGSPPGSVAFPRFYVVPNGSGHYTVLRRNGTRVMNLAKTPSDVRGVANEWKRFLRALAKPPRGV